jgi:4a-hydroxytetrahydrobiopterin dehydratase
MPKKMRVQEKMKAERVQTKMKAERVQSRLRRMKGWEATPKANAIIRTYTFPSFVVAVRFVDWVAALAESVNHHPDIDIRYNRVTVRLTTRDAGGVTEKDFELADLIDHR